jgi:hypothetical protein
MMEITALSYFLASIIAYLGLLVGVILVKLAPEEQNPGKKYFILLKKATFFLIIAILLIYYKINLFFSLSLLIFMAILMWNRRINLNKTQLVYFLLGIIFSLSGRIFNLLILESLLIFFYGIPTASLEFNIKKNNYKKNFLTNLWFFVPVIVLYFLL